MKSANKKKTANIEVVETYNIALALRRVEEAPSYDSERSKRALVHAVGMSGAFGTAAQKGDSRGTGLTLKSVANFLGSTNGSLADFEVTYVDERVPFSICATETFIVKECRSLQNAIQRFDRAVPRHGAIRSVRRVGK